MTLIKVKVKDTNITVREGVAKSSGKPYKISSQDIIVELNDEVRNARINLDNNSSAYAVGNYTIDPLTLLSVDQFGSIAFKPFAEIKLIPASNASQSMKL